MAAPANDNFANARYIFDGITFGDDTAGATLEPTEATNPAWRNTLLGVASVWYKWVADYDGTVTFSVVSSRANHYLDLFVGDGTDTFATITRLTTSSSLASVQVTVSEGRTYYIRIAGDGSFPTTFNLAFPVGRPPNVLSAPGSNDLPILSFGPIHMDALVEITEAIGAAPDSERTVTGFSLVAADQHSSDRRPVYLSRLSNGAPSYSCERWIRLRFTPPFGALGNVRFWVDNYRPRGGWELLWGISDMYRKPSLDASMVAVDPIPTSDPMTSNVDLDLVAGGEVAYSPWIVLQARWLGSAPGPIQADPLNWRFAWAET